MTTAPERPKATRTALLATLAAGGLLLSACGGSSSGADSTTTIEETTTSTSSTSALARTNPCEQLTAANKEELGINEQGDSKELVGAVRCSWTTQNGTLTVALNPEDGIDDLNFSDGEQESYSIASKQGKIVRGSTGMDCTVAVPFDETSSISVGGLVDDIPSSCELAKKAAPMVWKNLSEE
ncbi:hypothetical protein FHR84_003706 [Actinopolyspora biskrensis]|uniref:DUF3558 domain-containing protein n=1 Tax=Actinopolyspora biskrensis TaxID=1470178 RepID=A0A852Z3L6_9ACTN|nr:DUF3558 family protein [Actinopolyspora biskrensis]NYH80349.1 hypothetical protein [Actinopolyspora biskrensis]